MEKYIINKRIGNKQKPLFISGVDYDPATKLISHIYARSSFGEKGMIFSRLQLLGLIEQQDQIFYTDETSFYTRVAVYDKVFLNTQATGYHGDKLGHLFSIHNRLGKITPIEHKVLIQRAKEFVDFGTFPG